MYFLEGSLEGTFEGTFEGILFGRVSSLTKSHLAQHFQPGSFSSNNKAYALCLPSYLASYLRTKQARFRNLRKIYSFSDRCPIV